MHVISETTLEGFMQQQKLIHDWNLFNQLTNNRDFDGNTIDTHKDVVLNGYQKIINFVNRGDK